MLTPADIRAGLGPLLHRTLGDGSAPIERAVADSRRCRPGDLFVALPGETLDGNDYLDDAFDRGAVAALAARLPEAVPPGRVVYHAPETLTALQRLGTWWRDRFAVRVVALTGTAGKTSTKEITAQVLGARRRVLKTEASLNGDIGLPLMLLRLRREHELAVLELGLFYMGEIRLQCELAKPDRGIVTNIGYTHAERLGSIDAIERAKGELVEALPADGMAALNRDDARVMAMAGRARCRIVTYGLHAEAQIRADSVEDHGLEGLAFQLRTPAGDAAVRTPLIGRHNVWNCLAAAAVAIDDGMTAAEVADALATATNPLRLTPVPGPNGSTILDDTYNAGPASMAAALDLLARLPGRHIAVLGDMLELGDEEERLHRELGEQAARAAAHLILIGPRMRWAAEAARAAGVTDVQSRDTAAGLADLIVAIARPGDTILMKASRGMALERTVAEVCTRAGTRADDPARPA